MISGNHTVRFLLREWVRDAGDAFLAAAFHRSQGWYQLTDPFFPYLMAHIPQGVQSHFGWNERTTWLPHVRTEILLWICTEVETLAREVEIDLETIRFKTWRTQRPKGGTFREGIEHIRRVAKEQQARTA